jgi:hypothetical protein
MYAFVPCHKIRWRGVTLPFNLSLWIFIQYIMALSWNDIRNRAIRFLTEWDPVCSVDAVDYDILVQQFTQEPFQGAEVCIVSQKPHYRTVK